MNKNKISNPAAVFNQEQFRELSAISDKKALLHLFTRLLLNIFLIYLMLFLSAESFELGLLLVWLIYATQFHFWGYAGIGHEFLHRRVFSSNFLNDFFYQFCSSLTWNNAAMFADTHLLHHRQTFSEDDVEAKSVRNWGVLHVLEYAFIDIRTLFRRISYVVVNALGFYPDLTPLAPNYAYSARVIVATNACLYGAFYFLSQDFLVTTLMALAPFSCSLLNKILAKAQHHGLVTYKDMGPLQFSRTLVLPRILGFIYANMNYHAEHHLAPTVPFYNLPKMHAILKSADLVSSKSFLSFFTQELRLLRAKC